ncbi:MAG: Uma2 family endonuclease [Chloroflexota bacterium]
MSIQAKEGITYLSYGIPFKRQTDSQNGHTTEAQSSNGATHQIKMPPIYWNVAKPIIQYQNGATPRGYVYLPDYEAELIPLQELKQKPWWPGTLPDHTQLPDSDGTFVKNFLEHPQSILITTSIRPVLDRIHPDGRYKIGQDGGIYWEHHYGGDPIDGCKAPDWCYIPDVDPGFPKSYVLWQELVPPRIIIEFVSDNGRRERDRTPVTGKFWVYENVIQPQYYAIYTESRSEIELYEWVNGQFRLVPQNSRGHYPVATMGIELGIWHGQYLNDTANWLRIWDSDGNLLLSGEERAESERRERELADQRAEAAEQRMQAEIAEKERMANYLRSLGIDPDNLPA